MSGDPSRSPSADDTRLGELALLAAVPLVSAFVVYRPLLGSYFLADDWFHLQSLVNDPLSRFIFAPYGNHLYLLRNTIFWLLFETFGAHPAWFFRAVLVTHLVNVALVFALLRRLCGGRVACLGATVWGTAPLQEGVLGWYSAHGQAVAATLVLAVLLDVARVAGERGRLGAGRVLCWALALFASCTSYGIAIGVFAVFPVVVWLLLRQRVDWRGWLALLAVLATLPVVYALLHRLYETAAGETERTLGLAYAFALDWRDNLPMLAHLLTAGTSGLIIGFVAPLSSYPTPLFYGVAAVVAAAVAATVVVGPGDVRRWLLAAVVLAIASYAIITAGRGALYAIMPVRAHGGGEPRYHYLPSLFAALACCLVLRALGERMRAPRLKTALLIVALVTLAGLWDRSGWRINQHEAAGDETAKTLQTIDVVLAQAPAGRPVYFKNRDFFAALLPAFFAGVVSVYAIYHPTDDRPVYFVDPNPVGRGGVLPGTRIARMLVAPDAVPAELRDALPAP